MKKHLLIAACLLGMMSGIIPAAQAQEKTTPRLTACLPWPTKPPVNV